MESKKELADKVHNIEKEKKIKRAILTGATGTVGSALIRELIDNNIEVLVLCRKDSVRNCNIPSHPLVTKEYCDLSELNNLKNKTGKQWDVFYHFAWSGTTGAARNDLYLQNLNVRYSLDAVNTAKEFGCHTFIGAGSQAEYGRVECVLKPDTPTFPEMGYGIAKLCAGQMTREYAHKLGIKHIWVRILSVYGLKDGSQSMVMSTINKLKNGEVPKFTPSEQMWDYLYSGDAAEAFRLIGEKGIDGKIYVLGSGQAKPLKEYIMELRDVVAPGSELGIGDIPYGEKQVMYLCADISEITADTGWKPSTQFREGITAIIQMMLHKY
ncbi:MAG: NAD(P)-dependent oxidoreductase [Clostridia bacterium]|nr:NAD(P)-dependent oxidoreductase [Clostridia bacterium]